MVNQPASLVSAHERALAFMTKVIHGVPDSAWREQSPCRDWTVRDVVNHITSENLWAEPLMDGQTVDQVGNRFDGDVLGDDPKTAWDQAAKSAAAAFGRAGALDRDVHVSWGDIPARAYLEQMTTDLVIHGWDIARGSGQAEDIPVDLVQLTTSLVEPMVSSGQTSGVFDEPIDVDASADAQTRLLALTGRVRSDPA